MSEQPIRHWTSVHMPLLIYLSCSLFLVVLGNVLLAFYGADYIPGYRTDFLSFPETFTAGFWLLLLAPFVIVPTVYVASRHLIKGAGPWVARAMPPISVAGYSIALAIMLGWIGWKVYQANALDLLRQASDSFSSVEARYAIRERLGFATLTVLQSLLTFWSFIAVINALRSRRAIWVILAIVSIISTTVFLVALNMKWPVVLFYLGVTISVFSFAERWAYVSTAASLIALVFVYLTISAFVFRVAPTAVPTEPQSSPVTTPAPPPVVTPSQSSEATVSVPVKTEWSFPRSDILEPATRLVASAVTNLPFFFKAAVIRLAYVYPYYYHEVEETGVMCGGILKQIERGACRPAKVIYERMYSGDQFQGRGTANISVHVSAFALGGWLLAALSLVATAFVLACFSSLPLEANAASGAFRVVGALAGYHLSQIPGEGIFIYEHGLLWVIILLGLVKMLTAVKARKA